MTIVSKLEYERNCYYKLKEEITSICNILTNNIDDIDESSIILEKSYVINEKNIFENKYKSILKRLEEINVVLLDTILPNIEYKIESITDEINNIMEKKYE